MNQPGFLGGDRTEITLPETQENLVKAAIGTGKPVVVVLTSGSAIAANYAAEHAAALLELWYGGEESGTAIAETLAGVNNPSGRLPVTFYKGIDQLPKFDDYSMDGRTYRYFKGDPLYGFGYGLSYSTFQYSAPKGQRTGAGAEVSVRVKNASGPEGDEVVQLYVNGSPDGAIRSLHGFERVHLRAGESKDVKIHLGRRGFAEGQGADRGRGRTARGQGPARGNQSALDVGSCARRMRDPPLHSLEEFRFVSMRQRQPSGENMSQGSTTNPDDMRPEYDFSGPGRLNGAV